VLNDRDQSSYQWADVEVPPPSRHARRDRGGLDDDAPGPDGRGGGRQSDGRAEEGGDEELATKRALLVDIDTERRKGNRIRRFTTHDSVADMEYELKRVEIEQNEKDAVGMMRDGLKLALTGVEFANTRLSLLELDGWSQEVTKDMDKYDRALARLYRKYWKRSATSPEMELAFGLISSMGMFHVRRKVMRGLGGGGVNALGLGLGAAAAAGNRSPATPQPTAEDDLSSSDESEPPNF